MSKIDVYILVLVDTQFFCGYRDFIVQRVDSIKVKLALNSGWFVFGSILGLELLPETELLR